MSIEVTAEKTAEGWVLLSADSYRDILAGPFAAESEIEPTCKDLDLQLRKRGARGAGKQLRDMQPGWLFRIDNYWYRLKGTENRSCILTVVGEGREEKMASNTFVTEISVTSLQ